MTRDEAHNKADELFKKGMEEGEKSLALKLSDFDDPSDYLKALAKGASVMVNYGKQASDTLKNYDE